MIFGDAKGCSSAFVHFVRDALSTIDILFLDGTHCKNRYGDPACNTRLNGNDKMFPLAFSIVSIENKKN